MSPVLPTSTLALSISPQAAPSPPPAPPPWPQAAPFP